MSLDHVSAEFQEGYRAFEEDDAECPYEENSISASEWQDGWDAAEDDIGYEQDERYLDDPRRGQAEGLNAWKKIL